MKLRLLVSCGESNKCWCGQVIICFGLQCAAEFGNVYHSSVCVGGDYGGRVTILNISAWVPSNLFLF